jgi:hypothetical protein
MDCIVSIQRVSLNNSQKIKVNHIIIDQYQQQVANSSFICYSLMMIVTVENIAECDAVWYNL